MSQRGLHKWMETTADIHHMVRNTKTEIFYEENENKSKGKLNVNKFWISTHKHNDWIDLRRVGRYLKRCGEFSDPLKLFLLFSLSVFTKYYPVLTSNILSFHFLGRPGGMNPVCFFRSTIRRSIFSSRSMIRTTDTSMVGSRRTVTMDRCSTIHNCLASSSDSPWTWKRTERAKAFWAASLQLPVLNQAIFLITGFFCLVK